MKTMLAVAVFAALCRAAGAQNFSKETLESAGALIKTAQESKARGEGRLQDQAPAAQDPLEGKTVCTLGPQQGQGRDGGVIAVPDAACGTVISYERRMIRRDGALMNAERIVVELDNAAVEFREEGAAGGHDRLTVDPASGLYVKGGAYLMVEPSWTRAQRESYRFFQDNRCAYAELGTGNAFELGAGDRYQHSLGFMRLTKTGLFFAPVLGASFDYDPKTMALVMKTVIVRFDPMLPSWLGGGNSGIGDKVYFSKNYPLKPNMRETVSLGSGDIVEFSCERR
ncbi:MAG: hypothetical protein HY077_04565 [Elusimicrobia bacterium]|nr:hypothetical protein [Elusimicrobiota bacterium]